MFLEVNRVKTPTLPITPLAVQRIDFQGPMKRTEGFNEHQFIWLTEGSGIFEIGNESKILTKDMGILIKKDVPHAYRAYADKFSTRWVTFLGGESVLDYYNIDSYLFFDVPHFMNDSTNYLDKLCSQSNEIMRSAHMYQWIAEILHSIFKKYTALDEVVNNYLENNLTMPIDLNEISEALGIDKFRLCHKYSELTGDTVMNTLKKLRISKAERLLRYTQFPIEKVASLCGYGDPCYFAKIFKEKNKISPRSYRKEKMK